MLPPKNNNNKKHPSASEDISSKIKIKSNLCEKNIALVAATTAVDNNRATGATYFNLLVQPVYSQNSMKAHSQKSVKVCSAH